MRVEMASTYRPGLQDGGGKVRKRLPKGMKVSEQPPEVIGRLLREVGPPPIPKCASLGFYDYPFLVKASSVGMFCSLVAIILPYWIWMTDYDASNYVVAGLWYYCEHNADKCHSIHDNVMNNGIHNVPVWFIMVQWSYLIGTAMSVIVLACIMHNYNGKTIKMPPTVYTSAECVSGIAALQKFVSIYTFLSYFDNLEFIYSPYEDYDLHASFYCACVGFVCDVIIGIFLFLEEDIGPVPSTNGMINRALYKNAKLYNQGADMYVYNPNTKQLEYHFQAA